jgi:hypothetical protein
MSAILRCRIPLPACQLSEIDCDRRRLPLPVDATWQYLSEKKFTTNPLHCPASRTNAAQRALVPTFSSGAIAPAAAQCFARPDHFRPAISVRSAPPAEVPRHRHTHHQSSCRRKESEHQQTTDVRRHRGTTWLTRFSTHWRIRYFYVTKMRIPPSRVRTYSARKSVTANAVRSHLPFVYWIN